jgi:hypothetical protein
MHSLSKYCTFLLFFRIFFSHYRIDTFLVSWSDLFLLFEPVHPCSDVLSSGDGTFSEEKLSRMRYLKVSLSFPANIKPWNHLYRNHRHVSIKLLETCCRVKSVEHLFQTKENCSYSDTVNHLRCEASKDALTSFLLTFMVGMWFKNKRRPMCVL